MHRIYNPSDMRINFLHGGTDVTIPVGVSGPWPVELAQRAQMKFHASHGLVVLHDDPPPQRRPIPPDPSPRPEVEEEPEPAPKIVKAVKAEAAPAADEPEETSTRRGRAAARAKRSK